MNTYQKISQLTHEQVVARLQAPDERFRAAARSTLDTHYRRTSDCPDVLSVADDVSMPELPDIRELPQALKDVLHTDSISSFHSGNWADVPLTFIHRDCMLQGGRCVLKRAATPSQLVQAIEAADAYADEAEAITRQFHVSVKAAIAAHVEIEAAAVNKLAALVAQM